MDTETEEQVELTQEQELFCKFYASDAELFGNGVKSYMKAYPDSSYDSARSSASVFLTNPNILRRINELLELGALNDEFVDKQLAFLITQNNELNTKLGAIKEYNALKSRITKRIELGGDFEETRKKLGTILDESAGQNDIQDDSQAADTPTV